MAVHMVLIRTDKTTSVIKASSEEAIKRGIRVRRVRGEVIEKMDCAAHCPCDGRYGAGLVDFEGNEI